VLSLPNTSEAVLIDTGETDNHHPREKRTPGERLAALALANTYGKAVPFSGPVFQSSARDGDGIRVTFTHADGGLVAKPLPDTYVVNSIKGETAPLVRNSPESEVEGFAICGDDHQWKWAQAKIDGDAVKVWSPQVSHPVAVRYAWANSPTCNLYNGSGLPAAPFRTDDFPLTTQNKVYYK
jgi:sialate O-acetylesterase